MSKEGRYTINPLVLLQKMQVCQDLESLVMFMRAFPDMPCREALDMMNNNATMTRNSDGTYTVFSHTEED